MAELSQNSILRISDEKTLQLLTLYEQEQCLWNTHLEDYKNREKRSEAAERIALTLNVANFEAKHVMIKFKNLRNSYCQELKKIANSAYSDDDGYKPKVFWFNKMDSFLRPHLQPARSSIPANLLQPEGCYKRDLDLADTEEMVQMSNPEDVLPPEMSVHEQTYSENEESPCDSGAKKRKTSRNMSKRQKIDKEFEQKAIMQALKDISAHLHVAVSQSVDCFDSFGKYIAALLRSMPPQRALMLQPKIVALIASDAVGNHEEHISQSDESMNTGR